MIFSYTLFTFQRNFILIDIRMEENVAVALQPIMFAYIMFVKNKFDSKMAVPLYATFNASVKNNNVSSRRQQTILFTAGDFRMGNFKSHILC